MIYVGKPRVNLECGSAQPSLFSVVIRKHIYIRGKRNWNDQTGLAVVAILDALMDLTITCTNHSYPTSSLTAKWAHCKVVFVFDTFLLLQGREQMHAKLDKLCPSLKQMDYSDYMHFLRVFFGLSNLKNKGIIWYGSEGDMNMITCKLKTYCDVPLLIVLENLLWCISTHCIGKLLVIYHCSSYYCIISVSLFSLFSVLFLISFNKCKNKNLNLRLKVKFWPRQLVA